ncbi:hypothetical protein BUALT_Bualt18G0056900 [Buddleja alternifolia]|uniref:Uncharacterized protein n=1 Tax=Buddleja alternifolia TaxID=168488 RepID=A0AAV6WDA2_9LAMI|nr:hypothetical protein BUALT_Bualt18G0056900 [Buddleja alternifolia]
MLSKWTIESSDGLVAHSQGRGNLLPLYRDEILGRNGGKESGKSNVASAAALEDAVGASCFVEQWQGKDVSFVLSKDNLDAEKRIKWETSGLEGVALKLVEVLWRRDLQPLNFLNSYGDVIFNLADFLTKDDRHFSAKDECVSSVFELAMECVVFLPEERINTIRVAAAMQKIKTRLVTSNRMH